MTGAKIKGVGSYLPEKVLTNEDLEKIVDTNDAWITRMTGIKKRRIASSEESTSDLCYKASQRAIEDAGLSPSDIDMIIVGTSTPDMLFPATACLLQKKLGCKSGIPVWDFEIACSSFIYGLIMATQFLKTGDYKHILVSTGDIMSRILNYEDRGTCILFGDGASSVVLSASEENHVLGFDWGSNPYEPVDFLYVRGGGSLPFPKEAGCVSNPHIVMDGPEIYRLAVKQMSESLEMAIKKAGIKSEDLDFVIPHQANIRIMNSVAKHLGLPEEKLISTIAEHGNTSGATVGLALDIARKEGKIKPGQILGLTAFGAGLAWASAVIKL